MGKGRQIYNTIIRGCQGRGIEVIDVAEIMFDSALSVYHKDPGLFLRLCTAKAKELYVWKEMIEDDPEFGSEIDNIQFVFMLNGVANILEISEEGMMER